MRALTVLVGILVAGCFNIGQPITVPSFALPSGLSRDRAPAGGIRFDVNDTVIIDTGGNSVQFSIGDDPDARFTGISGCESRHFLADYTDNVQLLFGFDADKAHLLFGRELYYFDEPPQINGDQLTWKADFDAAGGNPAVSLEVDVACPLPSAS